MARLVKIKINNEKKPLYDIEVENNHNFVVNNGIVIKNSEQYLSRDGLCVLSSENAGRFSIIPQEYEKQQERIAFSMNRFLDNICTMEVREGTYATPFQKLGIEKLRRTGAGIINMDGWLFKNNMEYGSANGNKAITKFVESFNYYLYKSSIEIGSEKGNFGLFDKKKFEQSPFVQRMMKKGLVFETMRNCTCSSIAPGGTVSLMFRDLVFSYGIEPAFNVYFWKRTRMAGHYDYYFCVPSVVREVFRQHGLEIPIESDSIKDTIDGKKGKPIADFIDANIKKLGINFKKSTEIKALDKLDLMSQVMKWIDSSISVTYMLPEDSKWQDVYDFIMEAHKREVKSIAAFPDKKMYGIVSFIPFKDLAIKLINDGVTISEQNFSEKEWSDIREITGKGPKTEGKITKTTAPKRPKILPCDIHHTKITKKLDKIRTFDYVVFVGLLNDDPYEVFVVENGFLDKQIKSGNIIKKNKGVYSLEYTGGEIEDITKDTTESEDVLTRLVSCSLRHGADINFIVDQLEKSEGDLLSFSKVICRVLKKYVKNGTKAGLCPRCGSELVRWEGCKTCTNVKCDYKGCE